MLKNVGFMLLIYLLQGFSTFLTPQPKKLETLLLRPNVSSLGLPCCPEKSGHVRNGGWSFRPTTFCPTTLCPCFLSYFFCPTTFGPISKKRSLVKGTLNPTLNQTPNPNPKPYWTKRRGQSVVGPKVVGRKVGTRSRILC